MRSVQFLLTLSFVLAWLAEAECSEGGELEELVDTYVDTHRRLLNGSTTTDELLTSLIEDPWKSASIAENLGSALVNGSLGYHDRRYIYLRREFSALFGKLHALYDDVQKYLAGEKQTAQDYPFSCWGAGPCFVRTLDSFDILIESTGRILKSVAAPFKNLVYYYENDDLHDVLKEASQEQNEDAKTRHLVDICGWHYHSSTDHRLCTTVECALRAVDRIMGPACEETDSETLAEFYTCYGCQKWNLTAAENRCFHKFLTRYSNYSARIYDSFAGNIGTYLRMELDVFGFCRHIFETRTPIANFTERRQEVLELVQGIAKQLLRGKEALKKDGVGKSKPWTELARPAVYAGIDVVAKGSDFPYPSPDGAVEKYQQIGEEIIMSIFMNNFNRETYRYETVVYKPSSDTEEVCIINSNDDVAQGEYKNVNYLVSRVEARLMSAMSKRMEKEKATIQMSFGKSTKKDLCERTRDVENKLGYKLTGQGFRTMLVTKCARKFIWYELAWQHFRTAWSTSSGLQPSGTLEIFASNGNYDTQCASVVLIP